MLFEKFLRLKQLGGRVGKKVEISMPGFFFSGSTAAKLDEKGRFVLPQEMRFGLVENGALEFSIALGLGGCLAIYRKSAIEKIVHRFQDKQHIGKFQKFFTLFFSTLHPTTCDKVGRVGIPPLLRKAVGIKSEIVIAGVLNKIEIWPKEHYDAQLSSVLSGKDPEMDLAKMCEEAFELLDSTGEHANGIGQKKESAPTGNGLRGFDIFTGKVT